MNNNINHNNSTTNKVKSNSQKVINNKENKKTENKCKGIPTQGFDKVISKKYNTRNYNIPMSVTDRIKHTNLYSTSIVSSNSNSNRYKNKSSRYFISNRMIHLKK